MNNATTSNDDVASLRHDFDRLRSDIRDIRTEFSELFADALRAAKHGTEDAKQRIEHAVQTARAKGKESVQTVEEQVAAHPFLTLAGALGLGLIIGFGFGRKG